MRCLMIGYFSVSLIALQSIQPKSLALKEVKSKQWNYQMDQLRGSDGYNQTELTYSVNSLTISGFSTGGFMAANLAAMFNQQIDGAGLFSGGGPCAQAKQFCKRKESGQWYTHSGLVDMPTVVYHGTLDEVVDFGNASVTADWFEGKEADVQRLFIDDFLHVVPSNIKHNE